MDPNRSSVDVPEAASRRSAELPRKALHLLAAVAPLLALAVGRPTTVAVITPLAAAAVTADWFRSRNPGFEALIQRWFGFMMRPAERAIQGRMIVNGATWVTVSFAAMVLGFPFRIATLALFIFILGDAFAALVGGAVGRHRWPRSRRTLEGTAAFILVGAIAAAVFPGQPPLPAIPAVVAGALVEVLRGPLDDNVRVPLVIGFVLYLTGLLT